MTKVIFKDELAKAEILVKLANMHKQIQTGVPVNIAVLAARLGCDKDVLLELLIDMGCEVVE